MAVATSPVSITDVQRAHQDLISAEQSCAAGDMDSAQRICHDLLERHPDYAGALSVLAQTHMLRGEYSQAFPLLVRATMLDPKDWVALTNTGHVYLELAAPQRAISFLEKSLLLKPDEPSTLYFLGRALAITQDYVRAVEMLERACEVGSGDSAAPVWLCDCYIELQRYDDAARVLSQTLRAPLSRDIKAYAYRVASSLPKDIELDLDILKSLDEFGESQPEDLDVTQYNIAFARAECLERLGRHKDAWDCLVAANAPLANRYEDDTRKYAEQAEELLSICLNWIPRKKQPAKEAEGYPLSLYILGLSRSGKTTMEGLVGALPGVEMLQEHNLATSTAQYVSQGAGLLTTFNLCELPADLDPVIAKSYRARLKNSAGNADIVTITLPGSISDAGRLAECAPNVKFVFMNRNEDDIAFRIFGKLYNENTNQYAYGLDAIYRHISNHRRMIDNWLEKLGDQAMAVEYEDMVSDPEATLARVAKFCGLKSPSKIDLRVGDDTGCAEPYRKWLHAARGKL